MIRARLGRWEKLSGGNWQPRQDLVAGLVITKRALDLAEQAVRSGAPWAKVFGPTTPRPGRCPGLVGPRG
ncbi:MAG: hypothetical protein ACLQVK_08150, partial [Acidimicrobiales bacterium]